MPSDLDVRLEAERDEFMKSGNHAVRFLLRKLDAAAQQVKDAMPTMHIEQIPKAQATYLVLTQEVPRIVTNILNAGVEKGKQKTLKEFLAE